MRRNAYVVVAYHVTIVAIGHGLLKNFRPFMVIGCVLLCVTAIAPGEMAGVGPLTESCQQIDLYLKL